MNGDTLEYKAEYFKTRPDASVEELLTLLPGLQVNADGSILYQGRQVAGVRVNDKDFFFHDLTIATRNLDAAMIDGVQVVRDKQHSKREVLDENQLPIIINLKMKREFLKANFGKFYASAATRERYEAGALLNTFRDTLQVSFIGFANNLARYGFDFSEMSRYGGLARAENAQYALPGTNGLMDLVSAGLNVNYDIKDKIKANLLYNYKQTRSINKVTGKSQAFYDTVQEEAESDIDSESRENQHSLRGFIRYHFDSTSHIAFDARGNLNRSRDHQQSLARTWRTDDQPVMDYQYQSTLRRHSGDYRHDLGFEKKFSNTWLLSLDQSLYKTDGSGFNESATLSRYYLLGDSLFDQGMHSNSDNSTLQLSQKLNIQFPWSKRAFLDVFSGYDLRKVRSLQDIQRRLNAPEFTNRNDVANNKGLKTTSFYAGVKGSFKISDPIRLTLGMRWMDRRNRFEYFGKRENRSNHQSYWLANASISYQRFRISYSGNITALPFYQIRVVDSDLSPTHYVHASPYFEDVLRHNLRARYNTFFTKTKTGFFFSANWNLKDKQTISARNYDTETGLSSTHSFQRKASPEYTLNLSLDQTLLTNRDWRISASGIFYGGRSADGVEVNGEENTMRHQRFRRSASLSFTYKNKLTFRPIYRFSSAKTRFKLESDNFQNHDNSANTIGASMMLSDVGKFRLESSYNLTNELAGLNNQRQNMHILNASLYFQVIKKGELKFSAFDILDQNVSNYFAVTENTNQYSRTETLRQYFMLGFVYRFLTPENDQEN